MNNWADTWMLKFRPDKCKTSRIGNSELDHHHDQYSLKQGIPPMESSSTEKGVGVIINDKLTFDKHITEEKVNKVNSIVGLIRRTFEFLNHKTFKL